jgi:type VI secretion system protein ImpK
MYTACSESLAVAAQLGMGAAPPAAPDLRRHIDQLLGSMQQRSRAAGASTEDITDATYAIVALLDEILVQTDWPGREAWQASTLQFGYFRENTAGEGFFHRLEILLREPRRAHVLLIYFHCLALGFQGRFAVSGRAGLPALVESVGTQLTSALRSCDGLAPNPIPPDVGRTLLSPQAPLVRVAVGLLGVAIVVFFALQAVLALQVRSSVSRMRDNSAHAEQR